MRRPGIGSRIRSARRVLRQGFLGAVFAIGLRLGWRGRLGGLGCCGLGRGGRAGCMRGGMWIMGMGRREGFEGRGWVGCDVGVFTRFVVNGDHTRLSINVQGFRLLIILICFLVRGESLSKRHCIFPGVVYVAMQK